MRHTVVLDEEPRQALRSLVRSGKAPARKIAHAHAPLKADEGKRTLWPPPSPAWALGPSTGCAAAFARRDWRARWSAGIPSGSSRPAAAAARRPALACSPAPEGRARWTLRLLADEVGVVEGGLSHEGVRRELGKTSRAPTGSHAG